MAKARRFDFPGVVWFEINFASPISSGTLLRKKAFSAQQSAFSPGQDALRAIWMIQLPATPLVHHDKLRRGDFAPRCVNQGHDLQDT